MLTKEDFTSDELAFLKAQKILLSQLFDARSRSATSWGEEAKAADQLFGLSEACYNGHRLRTRSGHCIVCDTARIAYARRFSAEGFVYLAASREKRILKVGSCVDTAQRERNLNFHGYGGASDWTVIAWAKTSSMGQLEYDIHHALRSISIERSYNKDGKLQVARELFEGNLAAVWQAYRARTDRIDPTKKWRHLRFASFDFQSPQTR